MTTTQGRLNRWLTLRGLLVALSMVVGVGLLARSVQTVGASGIRAGLTQVGWGFVAILALSGAREVVRTLAWMRSIEGPARLGFAQAFRARLAGEALSTLLPMGMLVGEPAKAAHVGPQIPFARAFAGLAVEFAFYTASLVPVMIAGTLVFMLGAHVRIATRSVGVAALLATAAVGVAASRYRRNPSGRKRAPSIPNAGLMGVVAQAVARTRRAGDLVVGFRTRHPEHVLPIAAHELSYQVLAIAEVYVTLWLVSPRPPTFTSALVLETVGRLITIAFQMLPMRVGVDEAGAALFADRLHLGGAIGVTLALVRKVRLLFWSAVGLALLMRRPAADASALVLSIPQRTAFTREPVTP